MINATNGMDLLVGWSLGSQFALAKTKEDEVKQGKNYYLSGLSQMAQLGILSAIISRIAEKALPKQFHMPGKIICQVTPLLTIPIILLMSAVKQGDYDNFRVIWSQYSPMALPEDLSERVITIFSFFAEHGGDVMRVAMLTGTTALLYLQDYHYAGAVLSALMYEAVDRMGWVPRKISLFVEKYMFYVSLVGSIIGGTILMKVVNAVMLPACLSTNFKNFLHEKVDEIAHSKFEIIGPTLAEMHKPLTDQKGMPFEKMVEILKAPLTIQKAENNMWDGYVAPQIPNPAFQINPAHCTKWATDSSNLPVDFDFDKLVPLFDEVNWTTKGHIIISLIKDDERFIDFLTEQFPGKNKQDVKQNFQHYFTELVTKEGKTQNEFAIEWTRKQLGILSDVLMGRTRVKGSQKDLDDGIDNISKVLPYLISLKKENNIVDFEDGLLKLAIEGGDYCGRGIKRASIELVSTVMQKDSTPEEWDPVTDYERKLRQGLQDQRIRIIEQCYKKIVQALQIPAEIAKDVHGFDIYRLLLGLGFVPLTKHEEEDISVVHIGVWEMYAPIREMMLKQYKNGLETAVYELGEIHFSTYMTNFINTQPQLNETQKAELLDLYINANDGKWSASETAERFHRLLFVILGIMEYKAEEEQEIELVPAGA